MAAKSDFGQKLLHDLRLRKERMSAAQSSARQTSHNSGDYHGNGARIHRSSQQVNAMESAKRHSGGSSNQIVLYEEGGKNSRQINNLSMAVAFAFQNTIKLRKNNLLVDFFDRLTGGSITFRKNDIARADHRSLSIHGSNPRFSDIQISESEVRKGVQKLNQIIRDCSNGTILDRTTIEMGQQLLRGAKNLEESLRKLAKMQEEASCQARGRTRSRIILIEEDEENNQDREEKQADKWRVDRPRFSFDKPSKNPGSAAKYVVSYLNDRSKENDMVSQRKHGEKRGEQEKGKICNVVAKLMGLEEFPQKEEKMGTQKDFCSKGKVGKQRKASSTIFPLHLNGSKPTTTEASGSKMDNKMMKSERNGAQKQANTLATRNGEERRTLQVIEKTKVQKQNLVAKKKNDHHQQLESLDPRKMKRADKIVYDKGRRKAMKDENERSKIPMKMNLQMVARKGTTVNGLTRPLKESANKLQNMKGEMDGKKSTSKSLELGRSIMSELSAEPGLAEQTNKLSSEEGPKTEKKRNFLPLPDNVCPQTNFPVQESEVKAHDSSVGHEKLHCQVRVTDISGKGHVTSARHKKLLTEAETELKEAVIRSQLFLNTAESLFKLNIPITFLHAAVQKHENRDNNLKLDCAYEVMKRRSRRNEATLHPYRTMKTISFFKIKSLDDLVRQLCKDIEMLKLYGGGEEYEEDMASYLHKMLEKDICNKHPEINCMWKHEWSNMMLMFSEEEDILRDVEQHLLSELLDELTHDIHFL